MTVEIEMSDEDFKTVSNYAAENKFSLPELFLKTLLEKIKFETISDEELLKISDEIMTEHDGVYRELATNKYLEE